MKQRTKRQTLVAKFSASALLLAASLVCTSVGIQNWNVNAETATDGYTIVCDSDVFTTTENYAYDATKSMITDEENGKTGLLVSSKQTGDAVDGASFTVQEKMTGAFSMDFRVFSENQYEHGSSNWSTHWLSKISGLYLDTFNPYNDLKEVKFVFQSVSNPEANFTVFVYGAGNYWAYSTVAYISVGSQTRATATDQLTDLYGTSFSNFNTPNTANSERASTYSGIAFDPTTMSVTARSFDALANNAIQQTALTKYSSGNLSSLSSADFTSGYTVETIFSDVTSDNYTGGLQADINTTTEVEANTGIYNNAAGVGYKGTFETPYARQANMLVYSINDKSVSATDLPGRTDVKPSDLISYNESELTVTDNKANSVFSGSGLNIRSVASGDSAENVGFDFNGYMLGEFDMTFGVTSKVSYQHSNSTNAATHYTMDTSDDLAVDEFNPYADLKEVAIKFTSKSDPEKFFTMYFRSGRESRAYITTARVWVNGDKNSEGFGLSDMSIDGTWTTDVSRGNNSFTPLFGTSFSNVGYSKETAISALPNKIRFDVETMKVYATSYNDNTQVETERLVRDLTDSSMITWYDEDPEFYKTLSKEDFAQGYTVSVAFTEVTANDCVGSESALAQFGWTEGGYVTFDEAYDRYADMTIYSLNGQEFGYTGSKMTDSGAPVVALTATSISIFEENDITPLYYDVVDGNVLASSGKVSVSTDNVSYEEITATDGKYLFTANRLSKVYYVKYEGFADAQGNAMNSVVYELTSNAPFVKMKEGASIRMDTSEEGNNSGIRFIAYMTREEYDLLNASVNDLKFFYVISAEGGKTLEEEVPADKIRITDTEVTLTAAVTGLSEDRYEVVWTGKLYMTFTYKDGTESGAIYADFNKNERTIKQVAQLALADTTVTYSEEQLAILNKYAGYTA